MALLYNYIIDMLARRLGAATSRFGTAAGRFGTATSRFGTALGTNPHLRRGMHSFTKNATEGLIGTIRSGRGLRNFTKRNAVMAGVTGRGKGYTSLHGFATPFKRIFVGALGIAFIAGAGKMLAGDRQLFDSFKEEAKVALLGKRPTGAEFEHAIPYRVFQNIMIDLSSPSHGFSDEVLATGYEKLAKLWSTSINTSWEHKDTNGIYNYVFSDIYSKDPTARKAPEISLIDRATNYKTEKGTFPPINDRGVMRPASTLKEFVDYSLTRINNSRDKLMDGIQNESATSSGDLKRFFSTASDRLSKITNERLLYHSEINAAAEQYSKIALQARLKPETTHAKLSELTKGWPIPKQEAVADQMRRYAKIRGSPFMSLAAAVGVGLLGSELNRESSPRGTLLGGNGINSDIITDSIIQGLITTSEEIDPTSIPPLDPSKSQKALILDEVKKYKKIATVVESQVPEIKAKYDEELELEAEAVAEGLEAVAEAAKTSGTRNGIMAEYYQGMRDGKMPAKEILRGGTHKKSKKPHKTRRYKRYLRRSRKATPRK